MKTNNHSSKGVNAHTIRCGLSLLVIVGVVVIPWTQQESTTLLLWYGYKKKNMNWTIFIIAIIILIWLHHLYQKKIDIEERKANVSSCSTIPPWISLRQKFKSYLDFKVIKESASSLLIANNKGEEFYFQMVATNNIIVYRVNGIIKKEWKFPFWVHENIMYHDIDQFYKKELLKKALQPNIPSVTWKVKEERMFTQEEIDAVSQAIVVASQYGNSVEFTMKLGGRCAYIPLDKSSNISVGEIVDMKQAKLLTLEKEGESNIVRVKI